MRQELKSIVRFIESQDLPSSFELIKDDIWDVSKNCFHTQETYVIDFKETIPSNFTDDYGIGIVRACTSFYNTFGGILIFGVRNGDLTIAGVANPIDIEALNRVLFEFCGIRAELLSKSYSVSTAEGGKTINLVLIPKRPLIRPVRLKRDLGKYKAGTLWIRDRAETLEAAQRHLPLVYSARTSLPSQADESGETVTIHRSLPPSPATMKNFIGRQSLLESLWDWFIFGDQPRMYLYGPGGSGKSTLAFELSKLIAEHGSQIAFPTGERLDYVIFLSAKETELNPVTGRQQNFQMMQFRDYREQCAQIIHHSGLLDEEQSLVSDEDTLEDKIKELFDNFTGLLIIDDIDALSRKHQDTGEEVLFSKALLAKKRTRILYTLRYQPPYALRASTGVPGLEDDAEFQAFVEAWCLQFDLKPPTREQMPIIKKETNRLPLLIETLLGLRKYCGSYESAVATFKQRGGDEARRYLYQREYDRLSQDSRSRQILAGLYLLGSPASFSTLSSLFQFSSEHVRDALIECSAIFVSTSEEETSGESLYQLVPPSIPFIAQASKGLAYYENLARAVQLYKNSDSSIAPGDAAKISRLERQIRSRQYEAIVKYCEALDDDDKFLIIPRVRSLLGQAYSELGIDNREKARQWFRAAEGLNYVDIFMMRRWYNMELHSGYNLNEAVRVCNKMIGDANIGPRYKSEFWSKLANCFIIEANSLGPGMRAKQLELLKQSIGAYFEALWVGRNDVDVNTSETPIWLERPVERLMYVAGDEIEHVFDLMEQLADRKHGISEVGVTIYLRFFIKSQDSSSSARIRARFMGLCTKTLKKIDATLKQIGPDRGFELLANTLRAAVASMK